MDRQRVAVYYRVSTARQTDLWFVPMIGSVNRQLQKKGVCMCVR